MSIWIGDLEFEVVFLCFQMQELLRGAKNAVSLAQVCFSFYFPVSNACFVNIVMNLCVCVCFQCWYYYKLV